MTDPKLTILNLLQDSWTHSTKPEFTTDWYNADITTPQITISHIYTNAKPTGFTENPSTAPRRLTARYTVDIWSHDQETRHELLKEIDKIIKSKTNNPGGELENITVGGWTDIDEGHQKPPLYRSRLELEVLYYG
jgi:hypothetical protein